MHKFNLSNNNNNKKNLEIRIQIGRETTGTIWKTENSIWTK